MCCHNAVPRSICAVSMCYSKFKAHVAQLQRDWYYFVLHLSVTFIWRQAQHSKLLAKVDEVEALMLSGEEMCSRCKEDKANQLKEGLRRLHSQTYQTILKSNKELVCLLTLDLLEIYCNFFLLVFLFNTPFNSVRLWLYLLCPLFFISIVIAFLNGSYPLPNVNFRVCLIFQFIHH